MAEEDFHVHGPHDHAVENGHGHGGDKFSGRIAVTTAVLATLGAIFSYIGNSESENSSTLKANAVLQRTEAGNAWEAYEGNALKIKFAELGYAISSGAEKEKFQKELDRLHHQNKNLFDHANQLNKNASQFSLTSDRLSDSRQRWAQATTAIQVAIAMAAIALLTRRKWLLGLVFLCTFASLMFAICAAIGV